jgi:lysophospholipase L1-like esterase
MIKVLLQMDEPLITGLLLSSLLNLFLLGLGSVLVVRRGGLNYVIRKINFWQTYKSRGTAMYDSPFYRDKKSHFETLPKIERKIMFLGDSLTDLCEWAEILKDDQIINRGICGDTTDGILNRINNIVESKPKKLFLMIGINDLNQGVPVEDVANNYQLILETLKDQVPEVQIFIQSLLPINNQLRNHDVNQKIIDLNYKLKQLAETFSFQYINLLSAFLDKNNQLDAAYTSDGVHLNGQGYLIWKEIIEKDVVN